MVKLGRLIIFYKEGFEMEFLTEKLLFIASIMMVISRLFGTVLAQVLFIWGAKYIAWFTTFIV